MLWMRERQDDTKKKEEEKNSMCDKMSGKNTFRCDRSVPRRCTWVQICINICG